MAHSPFHSSTHRIPAKDQKAQPQQSFQAYWQRFGNYKETRNSIAPPPAAPTAIASTEPSPRPLASANESVGWERCLQIDAHNSYCSRTPKRLVAPTLCLGATALLSDNLCDPVSSIHHALTQVKKLAAQPEDTVFPPSTYQLICAMSLFPNSGHGLLPQTGAQGIFRGGTHGFSCTGPPTLYNGMEYKGFCCEADPGSRES